jgi:ABC-2 type transport system ATP-binding protein
MIVEIAALTKTYPAKPPSPATRALDGIDLAIPAGEIFGLLGPNGAGKTTTISICTTRALPSSGSVQIAGIDVVKHPSKARVHMGVVPQYNTLDRSLTIHENLYYHCRYFGFSAAAAKARSSELLNQFLLHERASAMPNELSGGLQQRVQIARAIAHRPAVLFLDEPSAGLDPQSRIAMWNAVRGLRDDGITVVLTTHYMEEADELCDRVAIVDHGRILALETPAHLKTTLGAETVMELTLRQTEALGPLIEAIRRMPQVTAAEATGAPGGSDPSAGSRGVRIFSQSSDGLLAEIVQAAQPYGVRDIRIAEPSLETVFIKLTGRELRE